MNSQENKFQLAAGHRYINCAYMSPLLKSVEEKGIEGMVRKRNPFLIKQDDYFNEISEVREKFARIIHGKAGEVVMIPSVSYGFASVLKNLPYQKGQHAIVIEGEFPSGYLSAERWCNDHGASLICISPEAEKQQRAKIWNEKILAAINDQTAFVLISSIHWMDGTKFDLPEIGKKCRETGAKLFIDGTQSVGAVPIDIRQIQADAIFCAGYKWLMGPYSQAYGWFDESFYQGVPLEESWMNRSNAHNFAQLANYGKNYFEDAARFNTGEASDFIKIPMANEALRQILEWGVSEILDYCSDLIKPLTGFLQENDFFFEEEAFRGNHLLGFYLPGHLDKVKLVDDLQREKIHLSLRGDSIRVSPNLYNTAEDIEVLIHTLKKNC